MSKRMLVLCVGWIVLGIVATWAVAGADEAAEKGRAILEAHRAATVTIRSVLSLSMGGQQQEFPTEANGTVVDPTGLTVLSLSAVDPSARLGMLRGNDMPEMTSKVSDMKIILMDGSEVPAEIVLRDKDLDLAFVRPVEKPATPMPFVSLDDPGTPQMLDELVVLGQLGKVARRTHTATLVRVEAIVDKPRLFYIPGEDRGRTILCSPAFTLDGKFVGIGVLRMIAGEGRGMGDDTIVIIVPAADIKEAATQAPPFGEKAKDIGAEEPAPSAPPAENAPATM
ncbi:MAG TPA: hypothetical protein PKY35_05370 [Candidatus Hydrogenedentes bacterium]|nr:hypothetical protein [Candidatus Hydrogenedentota bacterium]HOL76442.1 hypothetical protein [Candidatus Hydrogenedentota bacterium]HPO85480.1 hypothetical protein [Candidatus Hydrogenedentota bacterium]